jgi:hypothetical protein
MPLDLRVAIGLLLGTYGGILVLHGIVVRLTVLGVNVDLWWGTVMLACGLALLMFVQGRRSR